MLISHLAGCYDHGHLNGPQLMLNHQTIRETTQRAIDSYLNHSVLVCTVNGFDALDKHRLNASKFDHKVAL